MDSHDNPFLSLFGTLLYFVYNYFCPHHSTKETRNQYSVLMYVKK
ncbi:hypothetical protein CLOSTHATH_02874 [Hungatella hathewayi DSM 13479]|uniref:Uncharacterized protein n=1 Tax=Hungatella hathewayi DSM 13479 TaxID=566550 RepID=D3AGY8_9FIRM|nr:hypothetical protein CLOSTHATH_02874 [Hungatella hathewayi DSM 13479]